MATKTVGLTKEVIAERKKAEAERKRAEKAKEKEGNQSPEDNGAPEN